MQLIYKLGVNYAEPAEGDLIKRDWTLLFWDYDLQAVLDRQFASIGEKVRALGQSAFDAESDDFLAARIASSLVVSPVTLLEEDIQVSTKDAQIDVSHDFNRVTNPFGSTLVNGLEVTYHLPYTGDSNLLRCKPSTFTLNGVRAVVVGHELTFPFDSADRDVASTKKWFHENLSKLKQWLGWVNGDVASYNRRLEPEVRRQVTARRMELNRTAQEVAGLGYGVRRPTRDMDPAPLGPDAVSANRLARRKKARRTYDVALSFAGEDREYVEAVATALAGLGVSVFYDGFEKAELWGKDLAEHLGHIYGADARYTVIFASRHYAAKAWPSHEKSFALARHLKGDQGRILLVRIDDTEIPGIPGTIGYLDVRVLSPVQLAELIRQKIDLAELDV